jgi:hypothetical protein
MLWFYTLDNDSTQAHIGRRARNCLVAGDTQPQAARATTPTTKRKTSHDFKSARDQTTTTEDLARL